eukprot:TRINITY_DN256_c0_g1_i2.p1 TRINITY_DN256_c0_g1~~TRINITY_DN256_c0_g1_i2.p1  ORF type:complete len:158 (+),score=19.96 TRINITY_DN256_c0_g1_i2:163-636(+)
MTTKSGRMINSVLMLSSWGSVFSVVAHNNNGQPLECSSSLWSWSTGLQIFNVFTLSLGLIFTLLQRKTIQLNDRKVSAMKLAFTKRAITLSYFGILVAHFCLAAVIRHLLTIETLCTETKYYASLRLHTNLAVFFFPCLICITFVSGAIKKKTKKTQ